MNANSNKRNSHITPPCSNGHREESRAVVIKNAVSSVESATRFLKEVGVLNRQGNLSKFYKTKK